MKRILIDVHHVPENGWDVTIRGADGTSIGTRTMRRCIADGVLPVPLPSEADAAALPPAAPHRALCTAASPALAHELLARFAARDADTGASPASTAGDAERVGRWLFDCLLGTTLWSVVLQHAGPDAPVELSLGWPADDLALSRLPWELMYGPGGFLAAHPKRAIAITRSPLPAGSAPRGAPTRELRVRPRVLFVVGASLTDPAIQAGAEYLGLLRHLGSTGAVLASRVIIDATPQRVTDVVKSFAPSIVHFITHGRLDADGRGRLTLFSDVFRGLPQELVAEQVVALLGTGDSRPSVVVLNACETAGAADPTLPALSTPLAAELVQAGMSVVVGHTGRITDRACRLFTRRFYEALLEGQSLPLATAEGRRTARAIGADPASSIQWAMPALLLAHDVVPTAVLEDVERVGQIARRAARCLTINNPTAFCGRTECLDEFGAMVSDRSTMPVRLLAYEVAEREAGMATPRYGKTRLLQEVASHAVREGLIPCQVVFIGGSETPKDALTLGVEIVKSIRNARVEFELPQVAAGDYAVVRLRAWTPGADTSALPAAVQEELLLMGAAPRPSTLAVRAAIRADLAGLARDATITGTQHAPVAPVVVLIDDVHKFGDAARELLEHFVTADGLGVPGHPIPVVLAYTGGFVAGESDTAAQAITGFFESGKAFARRVYLRAFRGPVEDQLAYRQYLLHHDPPMVVSQEESVLAMLRKRVRGVPSRLERSVDNIDVQAVIETFEELKAVHPARDEDALDEIRNY